MAGGLQLLRPWPSVDLDCLAGRRIALDNGICSCELIKCLRRCKAKRLVNKNIGRSSKKLSRFLRRSEDAAHRGVRQIVSGRAAASRTKMRDVEGTNGAASQSLST